jgi:hypothetical protein
MVLEDLKKEHPDAISVVWLQPVARNVPDYSLCETKAMLELYYLTKENLLL